MIFGVMLLIAAFGYICVLVESNYGLEILKEYDWWKKLDPSVALIVRATTIIWMAFFLLYHFSKFLRICLNGLWLITKAICCRDVTVVLKNIDKNGIKK